MKFRFLFLFIFFIPFLTLAQKSRSQLEREKKENLKKIEEASKHLKEYKTKKTASLGQLNALKHKISGTEQLINTISKEIGLLNNEMGEIEGLVSAMQRDLEGLKKEYSVMVYTTARHQNNYNSLYYIFSASTFNQLYMRVKYLSQYSRERKEQVKQIMKVQETLFDQKEKIRNKKSEKDNLLLAQRRQNSTLISLREEKNAMVKELSAKEEELTKEIEDRKDDINRLEKLIASLIETEIKKTSKGTSTTKVALTPETEMLSNSFEGNRAKFFWPVASGFISQKFGVQDHAVLKGVKVDNSGIDIQTNKGESVRSIFEGTVEYVNFIPGFGNTIMIKHGEFFTVYAKLSKISVKKDQKVKTKEVIGEVLTDKDGNSELHFEIWKNMVKLDPEIWLFDKK